MAWYGTEAGVCKQITEGLCKHQYNDHQPFLGSERDGSIVIPKLAGSQTSTPRNATAGYSMSTISFCPRRSSSTSPFGLRLHILNTPYAESILLPARVFPGLIWWTVTAGGQGRYRCSRRFPSLWQQNWRLTWLVRKTRVGQCNNVKRMNHCNHPTPTVPPFDAYRSRRPEFPDTSFRISHSCRSAFPPQQA